MPAGSPWLVEYRSPAPRSRLVALAYAGGGAAMFEPWRRALPDTEIVAVRLPGREGRFREPPLTSVDDVVDALAPVIAERMRVGPVLPWVVFGYSLGALLAYELVARLVATGGPVPDLLVVGGAEAPQVPRVEPPVSWLPDQDLIRFLADLGGTPEEVLGQPELMALVLPMVRADLRILETYEHQPRPALPIPVVTHHATGDRTVRADAVLAWSHLTTARTVHRAMTGDHFEIDADPAAFAARVGSDLDHLC